ncbi:hypothetical protein ORI98_14060 [Shewanella sp. ULN5]|uniref:hypothetical protein n=1 Tax=Shewanella sp. ULN5 TaxID=2994678 RepID=UPI00273DBEEF|nr:hypothetical protein [Shewanella sp. ULN5]MDP5147563.1 hypothetical protein [Shewanella sp. ULN5]
MQYINAVISKLLTLLIIITSIVGCSLGKNLAPNEIVPNQVVNPKDSIIRDIETPGYDPTPRILVSTIPLNGIMIRNKAGSNISRINYQAENNRWIAEYFMEKKWKPINYKSIMIGKNNDIPAYIEVGSMRAEPCIQHYYILTNNADAIDIEGFNTCGAYAELLTEFLKSYSLPKGTKAYEVKTNSSWPSVFPR